jgi:aspartate 1-decarboxylase
MQVFLLRSKIHQARVTGADLNYMGSITIDPNLYEQADMLPYEKVLVVDIENGSRFETYVIPGERGSREVVLNGAAARLVSLGDRLIVMAFAALDYPPPADWKPTVIVLDQDNQIVRGDG